MKTKTVYRHPRTGKFVRQEDGVAQEVPIKQEIKIISTRERVDDFYKRISAKIAIKEEEQRLFNIMQEKRGKELAAALKLWFGIDG